MLDAEWRVHETDGPTLVAVVLATAAPTHRRVRVRSRLDGPVLPPRRRGLPEPGWTDDGFEGVVPAEGRLALGFAARAPPAEPPVTVSDLGRADGPRDGPADADVGRSPTDVVRALGSPAPPRDAVPSCDAGSDGAPPEERPGSDAAPDVTEGADGAERSDRDDAPEPGAEAPVPPAVAAWLDEVAGRTDRAATLAAARDLEAAAAAIEDHGGLAAVEALLADLAADEAALAAVADRARGLRADCAVRGDVPLWAYRRLA